MHDSFYACIARRCDKSLRVRNCCREGRAAVWKTNPISIDQRRCTTKRFPEQLRTVKVVRKGFYVIAERILTPRMIRQRPDAISTVKQQAGSVLTRIAERAGDGDCFSHDLSSRMQSGTGLTKVWE